MKRASKVTLFINFILIFLISSCVNDKYELYNWKEIQNCHNTENPDTAAIATKLVGQWKLISFFCGECLHPGIHYYDKKIIAEFTSDRRFIISENDVITYHGHWQFEIEDYHHWGLATDSLHRYLYGIITLCDNQVLFADSYIDGLDNYFERIK